MAGINDNLLEKRADLKETLVILITLPFACSLSQQYLPTTEEVLGAFLDICSCGQVGVLPIEYHVNKISVRLRYSNSIKLYLNY